MKPPILIWVHE